MSNLFGILTVTVPCKAGVMVPILACDYKVAVLNLHSSARCRLFRLTAVRHIIKITGGVPIPAL